MGAMVKVKNKKFSFFQDNPQPISPQRSCDHAGCPNAGEYRAPKSRDYPTDYLWFCLTHVQDYNAKWNYYQGMTIDQVLQENIWDTTWRRPSRPFGDAVQKKQPQFYDFFQLFQEEKHTHISKNLPLDVEKALKKFELTFPYNLGELKMRYKVLVKKYHPDLHGSNSQNEEILKEINVSFSVLKSFLYVPAKKQS